MIGSRQRKDRVEISRKGQYKYSKHKNTLRMGILGRGVMWVLQSYLTHHSPVHQQDAFENDIFLFSQKNITIYIIDISELYI